MVLTLTRTHLGAEPASAAAQVDQLTVQKAELELIAAQEAISSARSDRMWTAIAGLVGVASLVVSIVALRRGSR